ncbi:MAG: winged helix-turn-helix transcriptional regulator [Planctomycetes bacterium]|nr:winged helix-turn-helix transcriptional regulator [Planctomycetota bacterium]
MQPPPSLAQVFERRWAVPILAELHGASGCKFVTLSSHLSGSRSALKASLGLLDDLGLVVPNPGHGHPMRPEYVLTPRGALVTQPARSLMRALQKADSLDLGLKKWSMPTVHAIACGQERFGTIAEALLSATDRAVSLALTELQDQALVRRQLTEGRPPRSIYTLDRKAKRFTPILADLGQAMA